jgi:hypothetical protein
MKLEKKKRYNFRLFHRPTLRNERQTTESIL